MHFTRPRTLDRDDTTSRMQAAWNALLRILNHVWTCVQLVEQTTFEPDPQHTKALDSMRGRGWSHSRRRMAVAHALAHMQSLLRASATRAMHLMATLSRALPHTRERPGPPW